MPPLPDPSPAAALLLLSILCCSPLLQIPSDQGISFDKAPAMKARCACRRRRRCRCPCLLTSPAAPTSPLHCSLPVSMSATKCARPQAREIAAATKAALLSGQYDFVRCNFPNPGETSLTPCTVPRLRACLPRLTAPSSPPRLLHPSLLPPLQTWWATRAT